MHHDGFVLLQRNLNQPATAEQGDLPAQGPYDEWQRHDR
jgi:hypothetical protein